MQQIVNKYPFRIGVTSSLAMHIVLGLIATYVLIYEPPIDLTKVKAQTAVPVIFKARPPEPKPKPQQKPSLKKAEETPPEPVLEPLPLDIVELSPTPSYLALVKGLLEVHKRYPKLALERGHEGVVVLWFVVDRYGKVVNYRIERSSGSTILDGEVVRLIKKVSTFPMMPDETVKDSMEITMPIHFVLVDPK